MTLPIHPSRIRLYERYGPITALEAIVKPERQMDVLRYQHRGIPRCNNNNIHRHHGRRVTSLVADEQPCQLSGPYSAIGQNDRIHYIRAFVF